MTHCKRCLIEQTVENSYIHKSTNKFRSYCKKCLYDNQKDYSINNKEIIKECTKRASSKYKLNHPEKIKVYDSYYRGIRRSNIKQQCPSWANKKYISLFYKLAKIESERTGREVHVDHIVPLKGKLVSGLHCEYNLQLMYSNDNIRKSNSFKG